jgi:hypothetical protein
MTKQQRIMDEARANIERLAELKPRAVADDEDAMARWSRLKPKPEAPPREHRLDMEVPGPVSAAIAAAIAAERERLHLLLTELVGEIQSEADAALTALKEINAAREAKLASVVDQLHDLRIENANARAAVAELRAALASGERGKALIEQPARTVIN